MKLTLSRLLAQFSLDQHGEYIIDEYATKIGVYRTRVEEEVMLQANEEAHMGFKGRTIIILMIVGATIGAGIGYLATHSALDAVVMAVGLGLIWGAATLVPREVWKVLGDLLEVVGGGCECLSFFIVLSGACIVTLSGLLLWHSFAPAALAGIGMMTVLLVALSAWVRSHKDASALQ